MITDNQIRAVIEAAEKDGDSYAARYVEYAARRVAKEHGGGYSDALYSQTARVMAKMHEGRSLLDCVKNCFAMNNSTPLPWRREGMSIVTDEHCIATIETDGGYEAPPEEQIANLELIVRAVNSHDALLAACQSVDDAATLSGDNGQAYFEVHRILIKQVRAAIKLAEQ